MWKNNISVETSCNCEAANIHNLSPFVCGHWCWPNPQVPDFQLAVITTWKHLSLFLILQTLSTVSFQRTINNICKYSKTHKCTHMHSLAHSLTHLPPSHTHTHVRTHTHMHACKCVTHTHTHTHMHTHTCTHICTHPHPHTHPHTHTHTCEIPRWSKLTLPLI